MASYKEIREYVRNTYGISVETSWIAHAKELAGLPVEDAPNRISETERQKSCPVEHQATIIEALRHFGMLQD